MDCRTVSALVAGVFGVALSVAGTSAQAPAPAPPTFAKDVAPILYKSCVTCHRPGGIGPMSLITFRDARPYIRSIRARITDGTMPPWHAEAPSGTFRNDRRLTEAEKSTLVAWITGGAPQGDATDLPPAPTFPDGWTIGKPDVVLAMSTSYDVPASGKVDYQYFEIPTNFTEDKWVQAIEIRPGALSVVHHILAFSREPSPSPRPPVFMPKNIGPSLPPPAPPAAAPGANAQPQGFPGQPPKDPGALIATTAPGTNVQVFEPGQAMLIRAGSVLTFQVHYSANGSAATDRSSVAFIFAKQPPSQEVRSESFVNFMFQIPPNASDHKVESAIEFSQDARILALFPHTHLRGKRWEYRLIYPDGRSEVVLSVPKYDFNWQTYYEFVRPLAVPKGARLEATAWYDNSRANRSNPDPSAAVRWGEQTWDEMQYSGITFVAGDAKATAQGQGQQQ